MEDFGRQLAEALAAAAPGSGVSATPSISDLPGLAAEASQRLTSLASQLTRMREEHSRASLQAADSTVSLPDPARVEGLEARLAAVERLFWGVDVASYLDRVDQGQAQVAALTQQVAALQQLQAAAAGSAAGSPFARGFRDFGSRSLGAQSSGNPFEEEEPAGTAAASYPGSPGSLPLTPNAWQQDRLVSEMCAELSTIRADLASVRQHSMQVMAPMQAADVPAAALQAMQEQVQALAARVQAVEAAVPPAAAGQHQQEQQQQQHEQQQQQQRVDGLRSEVQHLTTALANMQQVMAKLQEQQHQSGQAASTAKVAGLEKTLEAVQQQAAVAAGSTAEQVQQMQQQLAAAQAAAASAAEQAAAAMGKATAAQQRADNALAQAMAATVQVMPGSASKASSRRQSQSNGLQSELDDMQQRLFDLRVELQNSIADVAGQVGGLAGFKADLEIVEASLKHRAEQAEVNAAEALEKAAALEQQLAQQLGQQVGQQQAGEQQAQQQEGLDRLSEQVAACTTVSTAAAQQAGSALAKVHKLAAHTKAIQAALVHYISTTNGSASSSPDGAPYQHVAVQPRSSSFDNMLYDDVDGEKYDSPRSAGEAGIGPGNARGPGGSGGAGPVLFRNATFDGDFTGSDEDEAQSGRATPLVGLAQAARAVAGGDSRLMQELLAGQVGRPEGGRAEQGSPQQQQQQQQGDLAEAGQTSIDLLSQGLLLQSGLADEDTLSEAFPSAPCSPAARDAARGPAAAHGSNLGHANSASEALLEAAPAPTAAAPAAAVSIRSRDDSATGLTLGKVPQLPGKGIGSHGNKILGLLPDIMYGDAEGGAGDVDGGSPTFITAYHGEVRPPPLIAQVMTARAHIAMVVPSSPAAGGHRRHSSDGSEASGSSDGSEPSSSSGSEDGPSAAARQALQHSMNFSSRSLPSYGERSEAKLSRSASLLRKLSISVPSSSDDEDEPGLQQRQAQSAPASRRATADLPPLAPSDARRAAGVLSASASRNSMGSRTQQLLGRMLGGGASGAAGDSDFDSSEDGDDEEEVAAAAAAATAAAYAQEPLQAPEGCYWVTVCTSSKPGAGTSSTPHIKLTGGEGLAVQRELAGSRRHLQRGQVASFLVDAGQGLGQVAGVRLWNEGRGFGASWLPERLVVHHLRTGELRAGCCSMLHALVFDCPLKWACCRTECNMLEACCRRAAMTDTADGRPCYGTDLVMRAASCHLPVPSVCSTQPC